MVNFEHVIAGHQDSSGHQNRIVLPILGNCRALEQDSSVQSLRFLAVLIFKI